MKMKLVLGLLGVTAVATTLLVWGPWLNPTSVVQPTTEGGGPVPSVPEAKAAEANAGKPQRAAGSKSAPALRPSSKAVADRFPGPEAFSAPIHSSLYQTFADKLPRATADPLSAVVARLMVWWMNPERDLRKGDAISVVYEPTKPEPTLLAIRFKSTKLGKTFEAFSFRPKGADFARFYDAKGGEVEARLLHSPIDHYEQITSRLSDGRGHQGIDFKAPLKTPVKAPFNATVARINWRTRRNGNCLDLKGSKNSRGYNVLFLHLDHMAKGLHPGQRVKQGEVVAYSGNTGHSTAPHLHYQLQHGRKVVDPFDNFPIEHRQVPAAAQVAFEKARHDLETRLDAN